MFRAESQPQRLHSGTPDHQAKTFTRLCEVSEHAITTSKKHVVTIRRILGAQNMLTRQKCLSTESKGYRLTARLNTMTSTTDIN